MAKIKTTYELGISNQPKTTKQKHIAPLTIIEERFQLHSLTQKELNKLNLHLEVGGLVKSSEDFSMFNTITNKTVKLIDTSEEVCNMIALVLVNWLSSEHSYVNEADKCYVKVDFFEIVSEETGEVFDTKIGDELFPVFSFTKEQAQTYLLNHIACVTDETRENHSWLIFENDTILGIDCLSYKIVQGEFEYTI